MKLKIFSAVAAGSIIAASLLMGGTAFAQDNGNNSGPGNSNQVRATALVQGDINLNLAKGDNDNDGDNGGKDVKNFEHATSTPRVAPTPIIQGNGEPVIGGTVSAVSTSTNTLTVAPSLGGVSYTVNASGAVVEKGNATSSVANIAVGDKVLVQGSISGLAVTATSVVDLTFTKKPTPTPVATTTASTTPKTHPFAGFSFWGRFGGFFSHMFGFF